MKKTLLVFDQYIDIDSLSESIGWADITKVAMFPLTSQRRLISQIGELISSKYSNKIDVELLKSSELIDREVDLLRERISKWFFELGEQRIDNKPLKEWFLLSEREVSTWYFSFLSERNTLKTDAFFNLAQLGAIDNILSPCNFDSCIFSIHKDILFYSIEALCKRHLLDAVHIPSRKIKLSFRKRVRLYLARPCVFNRILKTLVSLRINILNAVTARLIMGGVSSRLKDKIDGSILFVSHFPYVDKNALSKGELRNKYAAHLQEKFIQMKKQVIWIWMYACVDGYNFRDACKLAARFAKNGTVNFFLDEFMSPGILFRSLSLWFHQISIYMRLKKKIPDRILYEGLSIPEGAIFIKSLMADSFVGWRALEGILYLEIYKEIFANFSKASHCIYYFEMHAWERALNSAKKIKASRVKTIGFQHGSVSRNFFHYFPTEKEVSQKERSISLPMPDVVACNGDITSSLIRESGYPNIEKVEAIRQMYLKDYLDNSESYRKENIVLIAGSINREETKALISLFYETFRNPEDFQVWIKLHPLASKGIIEELDIGIKNTHYIIKNEPIGGVLKYVKVVIAGSSTVSLEALAMGCRVIIPIFSDTMFMSPLKGFEEYYFRVSTIDELKSAVQKSLSEDEKDNEGFRNFISRYWCLDDSLKRWEELLNI